jgi:hypothetical protein
MVSDGFNSSAGSVVTIGTLTSLVFLADPVTRVLSSGTEESDLGA